MSMPAPEDDGVVIRVAAASVNSTLISARATEGLARLLLYATAFYATRILSIGGPGSVGGFLAAELPLKK